MLKESIVVKIQLILLLCLYGVQTYLPDYQGVSIRKGVIYLWLTFIIIYYFKIPKLSIRSTVKIRQTVFFLAFITSVVTIMGSFALAMFIGFGKNPVRQDVIGIISNLLYVLIPLLGKEIIRAYTLCYLKKGPRWIITIGITLLFTVCEINFINVIRRYGTHDIREQVILYAEYIMPLFCKQLLVTSMVTYAGMKSALIYLVPMTMVEWTFPILPQLPWIWEGALGIFIPIMSLILLDETYQKLTGQVKKKHNKEEHILPYLGTSLFIIGIIWFMVGVFLYYPSAILTGSMKPMIEPGDVVIIRKLETLEDIKRLEVGQVIQFERQGFLINHRIVDKKIKDGKTYYHTKGDNNNVADFPWVEVEEIKGEIIFVVPKMGWLSVWLHRLRGWEGIG